MPRGPEFAHLEDGQIVVETWPPVNRGRGAARRPIERARADRQSGARVWTPTGAGAWTVVHAPAPITFQSMPLQPPNVTDTRME